MVRFARHQPSIINNQVRHFDPRSSDLINHAVSRGEKPQANNQNNLMALIKTYE